MSQNVSRLCYYSIINNERLKMILTYKAERIDRFGSLERQTMLALPVENEVIANDHLDHAVNSGWTILEMEIK